MDELLSLKWKNHCSTFLQILNVIRKDQTYSDVTLVCSGKFYDVHKMILAACSDYFREIFQHTNCKKPVIVLKGIDYEDLEVLLDYMYIGEVNVNQSDITSLIKAAECLQIKGLAVADDEPTKKSKLPSSKNSACSPIAKTKRKYSEDYSHFPDSKRSKVDAKYCSIIENENQFGINKIEEHIEDGKTVFIKEEFVETFTSTPVVEDSFQKSEQRLQEVCEDNSDMSTFIREPSHSQELPHYSEEILTGSNPTFQGNSSKWPSMESDIDYSSFNEFDNADASSQSSKALVSRKKCPYCLKEVSVLSQHIMIHTGEKPFSCDLCDYKSNQRTNLKGHMFRAHHKPL